MTQRGLTSVLALFETVYRSKFSPDEVRVWAMLLDDVADEDGARAAREICRQTSQLPKPADVMRFVQTYREERRLAGLQLPRLTEPADPDSPLVVAAKTQIREMLGKLTRTLEMPAP
jgi:hypothetical protein